MIEPFPLTPAQSLIHTGQMLSGRSPLYNMGWRFDIDGPLDPSRFARSFDEVAARYDALQLRIDEVDGTPMQWLASATPFPAVRDLSAAPDPEAALTALTSNWIAEPIALRDGTWRSFLARLGPDRWSWLFCQHHVATDAMAGQALFRAVSERYQDRPAAPTTSLRELAARPVDISARERWAEQAARAEGGNALYGRARDLSVPDSDAVLVRLGDSRMTALDELSARHGFRQISAGLTRFTIFATIHAAWLARVTGDTTVTFGAPVHLRSSLADRATPGLFAETLPLTVRVDAGDSFRTVHARARHAALDVLRHARPGVSTAATAAAFHSVLNYLPLDFGPFASLSARPELLHSGAHDPGHDLQLSICEFHGADGPVDLHFRLNRAVFGPHFAEAVPRHWLTLTEAMLADADTSIDRVALGGEILRGPAALSAGTVLGRFAAQVAATPDAVAITEGDRSLSYREFDTMISAYAEGCRSARADPDDTILVWARRSIETVAAIWGVLRAGCTFVPMAATTPEERVARIARGHGIRLAVLDETTNGRIDLIPVVPATPDPPFPQPERDAPAYAIFTSGSTGEPKGVLVDHQGLADYAAWAGREHPGDYALHSSLGFDLTITSLFVPFITGRKLVVYPETGEPDLAVLDVFWDDVVEVVKLTPAHLALVLETSPKVNRSRTLILGGEALPTALAARAAALSPSGLTVANEYGPTEAVVGAMLHRFDPEIDTAATVSIGLPGDGVSIAVMDAGGNPVPPGVPGDILIGGRLARGYLNRPDLTEDRFVEVGGVRLYRSGDLARIESDGRVTFLGRADDQLKVGSVRIEPAEIAAVITTVPGVTGAHVGLHAPCAPYDRDAPACARCGLSAQAPGGMQDADGVCEACRDFETYRNRAGAYFDTPETLRRIVTRMKGRRQGKYDAIMLLSGGKDSTYALYRLAELTPDILCLTLDNGYLSDEAKANIRAVAADLGLDHRFMTTPAMNAIFRDSLARHSNVCQGCFKTIYTLALRVAREEGVPAIVTGLSRGQFFETRLTPELFTEDAPRAEDIDRIVLEARKSYHRVQDAVAEHLYTADLADPAVFEEVEFIDIYRYLDVPLDEVYRALDERGWKRPQDTGRSTNCRINDLGIFVHTVREGYHNYAVPYAWDVRMGQKTRDEAIFELRDDIDADRMAALMDEIGLDPGSVRRAGRAELVAWIAGRFDPAAVAAALKAALPPEMGPVRVVPVSSLPLTTNGKVDRARLPDPRRGDHATTLHEPPKSGLETTLAALVTEITGAPRVGATDDFHQLGGDSLAAIQLAMRAGEIGIALDPADIFRHPTVRAMAEVAGARTTEKEPEEAPLLDLDRDALAAIETALGRE